MLYFRSEEHVARWCEAWRLSRGAVLTLEQGWSLAGAWFDDRRAASWRRKTVDEIELLFGSLGLTNAFWALK